MYLLVLSNVLLGGKDKSRTNGGTRHGLAPEGGAVNTPRGLSPGGTRAWELSIAQLRITLRCLLRDTATT